MGSAVNEEAAMMYAGVLTASYTLVQRREQDDWVAIGTVTSDVPGLDRPVWIIVGVGKSASDAEARLRSALEREAQRVERLQACLGMTVVRG